jgi:uncharacterized protein (DUF2141 family)
MLSVFLCTNEKQISPSKPFFCMWTLIIVLGWMTNSWNPLGDLKKSSNAGIILHLSEVKTTKGKILISLFNQPDGFPDDVEKAFKTWALDPAQTLNLGLIPPGDYALALFHDTDENKKMTVNLVGYPKEGFSSSPEGGSRWSKPNWKLARFKHGPNQTTLNLKMHY